MAFFQDNLGKPVREGQTMLDFPEAEMMWVAAWRNG